MSSQPLKEAIVAITQEQLVLFLEKTGYDRKCEVCGCGDWDVPMDDDKPSLVAMPSALIADGSNWFFLLSCEHCGNTKFVSAGHAVRWLKKDSQP